VACLSQLGGSFFHSPPGLLLAAPRGEPAFALLRRGENVIGLAAGVWRQCRLSRERRHFYSPSLPAVSVASPQPTAIAAWAEHLRRAGAAEVIFDSYDSRWGADALPNGTRLRQEYVVSLGSDAEQIAGRFAETHRRHVRRGEREAWALQMPAGHEAVTVLEQVCGWAAGRAEVRGDRFEPPLDTVRLIHEDRTGLQSAWGAQTFAAWHEHALLAAVLVGWANQRAYYLLGGSTPEGYRRSAAVWLHWRIMAMLAASGCRVYNLGGTAAAAVRPEDAAHGLYRFKQGFGGETVVCGGAYYPLRPGHLRLHQIAQYLSAVLWRSSRC